MYTFLSVVFKTFLSSIMGVLALEVRTSVAALCFLLLFRAVRPHRLDSMLSDKSARPRCPPTRRAVCVSPFPHVSSNCFGETEGREGKEGRGERGEGEVHRARKV
jgi:membrane-associated phospholipid phosphatase